VWCGCGVGVVVVWLWCGSGVGVVVVWCGCGVGVVVVWLWCRCGCGVVVVWLWCRCVVLPHGLRTKIIAVYVHYLGLYCILFRRFLISKLM